MMGRRLRQVTSRLVIDRPVFDGRLSDGRAYRLHRGLQGCAEK